MAGVSIRQTFSKVVKSPRRPFEGERILAELKLCGVYGLQNKTEVHRAATSLNKVRSSARNLLMLEQNHPQRLFEGAALLRRLHRYGIMKTEQDKLDYVLSLTVEDFLGRRLQTIVAKKLSMSPHKARVLIRGGHISVNGLVVNQPGFLVRVASEPTVTLDVNSTLNEANERHGRHYRAKHHE